MEVSVTLEILAWIAVFSLALCAIGLASISSRLIDIADKLGGIREELRANRNATALRNMQNRRTE
jgi:hypothetical protein